MAVLAITILCQVIIMQWLGIFFKVVPQVWQEWLVAIAIGFSSSIFSWIIRFLSRNVSFEDGCVTTIRSGHAPPGAHGRTASGRTISGRTMSGKKDNVGSGDRMFRTRSSVTDVKIAVLSPTAETK
jgi:hypothetical protein